MMNTGFDYISLFRLVHAGGNLNNGDNAGVAYRNSNNDLGNSNSNNGSQLSCLRKLASSQNLASWQKISKKSWVLVPSGTALE